MMMMFVCVIGAERPVPLELPNQWLWDIIDEFIYQVTNATPIDFTFTIFHLNECEIENERCNFSPDILWSVVVVPRFPTGGIPPNGEWGHLRGV